MKINYQFSPEALRGRIGRLWEASAGKILDIEERYDDAQGPPVCTEPGRYVRRDWAD